MNAFIINEVRPLTSLNLESLKSRMIVIIVIIIIILIIITITITIAIKIMIVMTIKICHSDIRNGR